MNPTNSSELTIARRITNKALAIQLNNCLRPSDPGLLAGMLGHIASIKGFSQLSRDTGIRRTSLYRILSINADPSFADVLRVIEALGFSLHFEAVAMETASINEPVTKDSHSLFGSLSSTQVVDAPGIPYAK